jgi:hypothetical protein
VFVAHLNISITAFPLCDYDLRRTGMQADLWTICGEWLGLYGQKAFVACLAPLKNLCHSAGHCVARLLSGGMAGLVGVAPYQPDGRQTKNILLMSYIKQMLRISMHMFAITLICSFFLISSQVRTESTQFGLLFSCSL